MKIRNRIAIQFTLIVTCLLIAHSLLIYSVSSNFREEEFFDRLTNRARTAGQLLSRVSEIDEKLLRIIDNNTFSGTRLESIMVYDDHNQLIYNSSETDSKRYDHTLLTKIRGLKHLEFYEGDTGNQVVGIIYDESGRDLVVIASAYDQYGLNKLSNLRNTLWWSLIIGTSLTVALSFYFAGNALQPISELNHQISTITVLNLKQRVTNHESHDEIGQLAQNFNTVLGKLELAFNQQKSFVYHASHELRTPLAAMKSEVQLAQLEYPTGQLHAVFQNLESDIDRLVGITNSLLFLARSLEDITQIKMQEVALDEILFDAKEELLMAHPYYNVSVQFEDIPQDERYTWVRGNGELLKRVFLNLMDNGCKYSNENTVEVSIATTNHQCLITFKDSGMGIPRQDLPYIFEPFYRSSNASSQRGYGIGLSICKRILELHKVPVRIDSQIDKGTTFYLEFNHIVST